MMFGHDYNARPKQGLILLDKKNKTRKYVFVFLSEE